MGSRSFSHTHPLPTPNLVFAGTVSRLIHASDDVTTPSLPFSFLAYDKEVVMKSLWKSCATAALICTLSLSAGCQSLPWVGNRKDEPSMTAQQYAEQAAANIQYDTTVDVGSDYQPSVATNSAASYSSLPPIVPQSSSGGSCCH